MLIAILLLGCAKHPDPTSIEGCRMADPAACVAVADWYASKKRPEEALAARADACRAGDGQQCSIVASTLGAQPLAALEWHARACDLGDADACVPVVAAAAEGRAHADAVAIATVQVRCPDDPGVCVAIARIRLSNRELGEALDMGDQGCSAGEPTACELAAVAAIGLGDDLGGFDRAGLACRAGVREGCDTGKVMADVAHCRMGENDACARAGRAFLSGIGVLPDRERATGLLSRACDGGDGEACAVLMSVDR